jgi:hypothetical protein
VSRCEACGKSIEAHEVRVLALRGGGDVQWSRALDGKARRVEVRCPHPAVLLRHAAAAWERFAADLDLLDLPDAARIREAAEQWCAEHGAVPVEVELFARVVRLGHERIGNVKFNGYYGPRQPITYRPAWTDGDVLDLLAAILGPLVEVAADPEDIAA